MAGPLSGVRVIEFVGIGPGPFAGMMLADQGAEVVSIDRPGGQFLDPEHDILMRSRTAIAVDLKSADGGAIARDLCREANVVIEGYRPGVMERLGLGPDVLLGDNPDLVYGRITGWGQEGPLAKAAGHDINYTALSGALHAFGRAGEKPTPPINLVGDFGGGGMLLVVGILSALLKARNGGGGDIVDCAMIDGAALLMASVRGMQSAGLWTEERGTNLLDTGAHFYDSYECADGRFIAIGAIEPQFYAQLCDMIGVGDPSIPQQMDRAKWPAMKDRFAELFRERTRAEWCDLLEGRDACFAPVLTMDEAPDHAHNIARRGFVEVGGDVHPAPAPRYSRSVASRPRPGRRPGADTRNVLLRLGYAPERIDALVSARVIFE